MERAGTGEEPFGDPGIIRTGDATLRGRGAVGQVAAEKRITPSGIDGARRGGSNSGPGSSKRICFDKDRPQN
jgi:hypothetical protein